MLKILLWIVGAILVLDIAIALFMALATLLQRRTYRRFDERAEQGALEPSEPIDPALRRAIRRRDSLHLVLPTDVSPQVRRRRTEGRLATVALVATILCAATVLASPQVRHVVAGAFDAVTGGSGNPVDAQDAGTSPNGGPDASSDADRRSPGAVPAPTMDAHGSGVVTTPAGDHPSADSEPNVVLKPDGPPALRVASVSATQVDLSWNDVADETGYRVERWADAGAAWIPIATTGQNVTFYTDAELTPGTTYAYRIFATNSGGDSPPSGVARATTTVDPASPPTLIAGSVSPSQIDLTWTDVANESGYRVERSPDGTGGWNTIATLDEDVTAFSDTDVAPGTTYFYRVFATNAGGDSPPSDVASATTGTATGTDPIETPASE